jgi:lipopolysaccharide assembly outer membrane protein LptD (OstA)
MNGLAISFAIPCALVIASHSAIAQSATRADEADPKYMLTTMPEGKGRLRLVAYSIDRDLASSVVHLKGSVRAEIWATAKNPGQAMVLRADEVDYNEITGEICPHGNVRVTLEEAR